MTTNIDMDIPDWARPMTEMELMQEAMDYEFNSAYDRYDGMRMDFCGVDLDYDPEDMIDHGATVNFVTIPWGHNDSQFVGPYSVIQKQFNDVPF